MSWNLRVIKNDADEKNEFYFIGEVYYSKNGNLRGYTHSKGVNLLAETESELKKYYEMCAEAFTKPTLNLGEFYEELTCDQQKL